MGIKYFVFTLPFLFFLIGCDTIKISLEQPLQHESRRGRFELHKTFNNWNYLLLDSWSGKLWQCQFTINSPAVEKIMEGCTPLDMENKAYLD